MVSVQKGAMLGIEMVVPWPRGANAAVAPRIEMWISSMSVYTILLRSIEFRAD